MARLNNCRFNPTAGGTTDWTYSSPVAGYNDPVTAGAVTTLPYEYFAISADQSQFEGGKGVCTITLGVPTFARTTVLLNSSGTTAKINFSAAPQVAIVVFVDDMLSFDQDQTANFSAAQTLQARTNLGMSTEIGKIEWWPTTVLQPGRLKANGATPLRATYPILFAYLVRSGTATFTNGSANVGMTAHNLSVADPIKLFTTGTLPTNFTAGTHGLPSVGTNYFVKAVVDANTVTLSSTVGGSAISAGSAGSGTHTWINAPYGDGDGSTTFGLPDYRGNFPRGWNDDASVDTNRTIGDMQLDAFQGHLHSATSSGGLHQTGAVAAWTGANSPGVTLNPTTPATPTITVGSPTSDGTNGPPRTAAETRPRNVSMMATIRYSA